MPVCIQFVRPSSWNKSAPPRRIFMKFDIWVFFEKSAQKIQVSLQYDKNYGYFTFATHLGQFFLELKMFQTKVLDKIKTHILYSTVSSEGGSFYGIVW